METENPLLKKFDTPFEVPPFEKIRIEHFIPAYEEAIKQHKAEIEQIVNNPEEANFDNTIVALDNSGELLHEVESIFGNLNETITNEEMQEIAKKMSPVTSAHYDDIYLNEKLFQRVETVYNQRSQRPTDAQQLLEKTYKRFVRGGANLSTEDKTRLRKINEELGMLEINFGENLLKETNSYKLVIEKKEDLAGLPESLISAAAETAEANGMKGKWIFTLHYPSIFPFLQYAENRELRKQIFTAYFSRGNNNNENDNKEIINEIVNLRLEKANLLGYKNHASFVLEKNMAKNPETVFELLNKLWKAALPNAKEEVAEMQAIVDKEGGDFKLESWDWWYYAEKVKKAKYNFDTEALKPYFQLENVIKGVFEVSTKLYGISFKKLDNMPLYHPEATVYQVIDNDGSHLGILYMDWFPRESKRGGAWMTSFREQYEKNGKDVRPVISIVGNFSKPTGNTPSLLTLDETLTLFHEFGHALHGLLSKGKYYSITGTSVSRDFVELPSQVMENWALEPEVLKLYAKHYQTGEIIPMELIEKLEQSSKFNQGFETVEYLAAALLDMNYHILTEKSKIDVVEFENKTLNKLGLIPEIISRYKSTYFAHIFSGGYSAGYYSYIWSGVLDADAFQAFKETDLFDAATAKSFRDNVISRGASDDAMNLYKAFRGREPEITPLLKRRGLID
ncbi:MAG: M3 family metallopeptidase [Bacteroidales bacterium]|nr:M3 family metallopeptidase [Bacteroidales bacterium]